MQRKTRERSCPEQDFLEYMEQERKRCERYTVGSSLVIFDISQVKSPTWKISRLIDALSRRVREVDRIGRLDGTRVGLLLPATAPVDAAKIVSDVLREYPPDEMPGFSVRHFPECAGTDVPYPHGASEPSVAG